MENPSRVAWDLQGIGNGAYVLGDDERARRSYQESRELFRQLGDEWGLACASNSLGSALFHLGDPAAARSLYRSALPVYQALDSAEGTAWSLERLGVVEAALGDAERAARVLGAASVIREQSGVPVAPWDQADLDRAAESLRARLGASGFDCLWNEGRRMDCGDAIADALS